jgi:hypothetical protein
MTQSQAEKIANVVIGAAAIGAAYYVLKTPPLRRLVWRLTAVALTGFIPAWLTQEIRASWDASAPPATAAQPSRETQARAV